MVVHEGLRALVRMAVPKSCVCACAHACARTRACTEAHTRVRAQLRLSFVFSVDLAKTRLHLGENVQYLNSYIADKRGILCPLQFLLVPNGATKAKVR